MATESTSTATIPTSSTQSPVPVPVVVNVAGQAPTWLQAHERLIIIVLFLALTGWLGTKWINRLAASDAQKNAVTQQQLADQKTADAQLATQVAQTAEQYKELAASVLQQNAQLSAGIAQRDTALAAQQKTDMAASNPQIATRWQQVANVAPNSVTPTQIGVDVTQQAARTTVSDLEQIPVLQKNVEALQTENQNLTSEVTVSDTLNSQMATQIGGLNLQIEDAEKACQAQVTAIKASERKSKLKWFGVGFASGFVAGVWITHAL